MKGPIQPEILVRFGARIFTLKFALGTGAMTHASAASMATKVGPAPLLKEAGASGSEGISGHERR